MDDRITLNLIQNRLKTRQLMTFNAVLNERSIAKAAERLSLTQPAVTRTIRELEALFACKLFERTNRGVMPTVFGQVLGEYAQASIVGLRHVVERFNALQDCEEGHLLIGTLISASAQLLPHAIAAIKERSPKLAVTVREGGNDLLFPLLISGEIDIVIGRLPEHAVDSGIEHHVLYKEPLVALVSGSHPLARSKDHLSLKKLLDYQWILPVPEVPFRSRVRELFARAALPMPERIVESISIATNLGMLDTMSAIALLPGSIGEYYADLCNYHVLEGIDLGDFGDVGYTVYGQRQLTPSTELFIDCLNEVLGNWHIQGDRHAV